MSPMSLFGGIMPASTWTIMNLLNNANHWAQIIGALVVVIVGVFAMIYGGITVFRAITGRTGSTGPHWIKAILCLLGGGILTYSGGRVIFNLGQAGNDLMNKLGNDINVSQVLPMSTTTSKQALSQFIK